MVAWLDMRSAGLPRRERITSLRRRTGSGAHARARSPPARTPDRNASNHSSERIRVNATVEARRRGIVRLDTPRRLTSGTAPSVSGRDVRPEHPDRAGTAGDDCHLAARGEFRERTLDAHDVGLKVGRAARRCTSAAPVAVPAITATRPVSIAYPLSARSAASGRPKNPMFTAEIAGKANVCSCRIGLWNGRFLSRWTSSPRSTSRRGRTGDLGRVSCSRRDLDRLEAVAARLLVGVHERLVPFGAGASSTPAWAQWKAGQRFQDVKASLDAGFACEQLPLTAKAWAQGEISSSAARSITHGMRDGHEDLYPGAKRNSSSPRPGGSSVNSTTRSGRIGGGSTSSRRRSRGTATACISRRSWTGGR